MSIRKLLLLAFIVVGMLPAALVMWLAASRSEAALQQQIEDAAARVAAATAGDLDDLLRERAQNATTWTHVEVMQDLRLGDLDKRLSGFLAEMYRRYGSVYAGLHAVDRDGRVIASSDPAAIGTRRPAMPAWLALRLPGGPVAVAPPAADPAQRRLSLATPIDSAFGDGTIGTLWLDLPWSTFAEQLDPLAGNGREIAVSTADGRLLAVSAGLRARGHDFGQPMPADPAALAEGPAIIARADAGFTGWTVWIIESRAVALAPVRQMLRRFALLLVATLLVILVASIAVSARIARPVQALTRYTRNYLQPGSGAPPPEAGPAEVRALGRSFGELVGQLEESQGALIRASRPAALGEVTALMAHEVRTPVGILRSSAQMLGDEPQLGADARELLAIIVSETERLNRLVATMLDQTRMRAPLLAACDFHAIVRHAISLLAAQARDRRVTVGFEAAALRPQIDADAEQLTQVLLNLVGNALQIVPAGGRVRIGTADEPGRLVCTIDDDGPGIAPEDRQRLFEPFVHKREGGVGLGLAVVRQIVRAHHGDVVAEAAPLGGARIRFWLPCPPTAR